MASAGRGVAASTAAEAPREVLSTGSAALDVCLDGGVPHGALLLFSGPAGTGATELAFALARSRIVSGGRATFATALRSAPRVQREAARLFPRGELQRMRIELLSAEHAPQECLRLTEAMKAGDVLVVESTGALRRAGHDVVALAQEMADTAAATGGIVVLLHADDALPPADEAGLHEAAEGILAFRWLEGMTGMRRLLVVRALRGLSEALEHEAVPVFEVALARGTGVVVSRVQSLV